MATYHGNKTQLYQMLESTWGTKVAPTTPTSTSDEKSMIYKSLTFNEASNAYTENQAGTRAPRYVGAGGAAVSGNLTGDLNGLMPLMWVLGGCSGADVGAPYTWVVTPSGQDISPHPFTTVAITKGTAQDSISLPGCIATSLGLTFETGAPVGANLGFIAADIDDASVTPPTTNTVDDADPFIPENISLELPDGTQLLTCRSASIDIGVTGGETHNGIGSRAIQGINPGVLQISGSLEVAMVDQATPSAALLEKATGGSTIQDQLSGTTLTLDDNYADAAADTWKLELTDLYLDYGRVFDGTASPIETVNFMAKALTGTWEAPIASTDYNQ